MKQNNSQKINSAAGFSLVEMLVAIGIFMSIMTIAITALISIIAADRKSQAIKGTIDSVTFAVEDMSRDMRIGTGYQCSQNNTDFYDSCLDESGYNVGGTAVRYLRDAGGGVQRGVIYKYKDSARPNSILEKEDCDSNFTALSCVPVDLISQDAGVNISNIKFYVIGADSAVTQSRVVMTISGLISVKGSTNTEFNLQTNISQRARGSI